MVRYIFTLSVSSSEWPASQEHDISKQACTRGRLVVLNVFVNKSLVYGATLFLGVLM